MTMPLTKHLKDTDPFNQLPQNLLEEILAAATTRTYPPNVFIFQQNDQPTGYLYIIKEGLVEITVLSPGGVDMIVDYRKDGQFLGGTPVFTGEPYTGGARTTKKTECYLIPQDVLLRAQEVAPQLGGYFTRAIYSRVRDLYSEIVSEHTQNALTHMEAYPFKKRLSEIMSSPVISCPPETTAQQVARILTEGRIGSIVVLDPQGKMLGMITEYDLVAKVIAPENGGDRTTMTAREIMATQVPTLSPDTYMFEAMTFMNARRLKYLPVIDRGDVVGMVSLRDLMRYRSQKAMILMGSIKEETSLKKLAEIHKELVIIARTLLSETRSTPEVLEILSYLHHGLIRRVYELCLQEMASEGHKAPEVRYCFMIMGSGGRREMLLAPDQDNGFVYEDVPQEKQAEVEAFFAPLSEKIVAGLEKVGYPLCDGNVMCNNPDWRGTLREWKFRISSWVNNPEPQRVRNCSIFFDFAPLAGDPGLTHELRNVVHQEIRAFEGFLYHMMQLDLRYRVPVGMLGRFILDKSEKHKGQISIKQGGIIYIVDCIRMFALEKEIHAITTLDRLKLLVEKNVFSQETAEHIRAAFEALGFLRLRHEIEQVEQGKPPSHFLNPYALSKNEQDLLKESLHAVSKLQDAAKRHFSRNPF